MKLSNWFATRRAAMHLATIWVLCASLSEPGVSASDDQDEQPRARRLERMRTLAEQTKVRFENGERAPELVGNPVFRYDDQPRRFIDATMWVWTDAGRPIAIEKIEAMRQDARPRWGYCFASLARETLSVEWANGRRFRSTAPGVEFRPLHDEPSVAQRTSERARQVRSLARGFSARILTDAGAQNSEAMRLLATPIYEYTEPATDVLAGAVFGFTTSGTNPDLLVVLEARGEKDHLHWQFAPARVTAGGVTLSYRDQEVWEVPHVEPRAASFPTWTFFNTLADDDEL
jgi:hypothetical protein